MRAASAGRAPAANGSAPPPVVDDDDDLVTRQMVDKRQSRKVNSLSFLAAIEGWRAQHQKQRPEHPTSLREPLSQIGEACGGGKPAARRVRVIARKRPLFAHETARGDFDVVTVAPCGGARQLTVHSCCMQPDLKGMFLRHCEFSVCEAFGEGASTEEVCTRAIAPLLQNVAGGGCSTIFMYGQTGSGKTYTMAGIEAAAAELLLSTAGAGAGACEGVAQLSYFEIAGSRCSDLLSAGNAALELKQDAEGRVQLLGAASVPVESPGQLLALLESAKGRRATSSTMANASSSRSHAVCQLRLPSGRRRGAVLTLVDCAGSERKEDSMHHSAEQRKEGAEINQSLHALKECMRHWTLSNEGRGNVHIPFRSSALTRVLSDSFTREDTLMAVVGTVSPASADTEHSISTLKTVCAIAADQGRVRESKQDVRKLVPDGPPVRQPPKAWDAAKVRQWVEQANQGMFAGLLPALPPTLDGKVLMTMSAKKMSSLWNASDELTGALFQELRLETKRAAESDKQKRQGARATSRRQRSGGV